MSVEVGASAEGQRSDVGGFLLARAAEVAHKEGGVSAPCNAPSALGAVVNGTEPGARLIGSLCRVVAGSGGLV